MLNKDLSRILDIQAQPGKEHILARKMSLLIKDVDKACRRWQAAEQVFGGSHVVTNIFWRRFQELNGNIVVNIPEPIAIEIKTPKVVKETSIIYNRIIRKKTDFPINSIVRFNGNSGEVISHHEEEDKVFILFENGQELIDIYELKKV